MLKNYGVARKDVERERVASVQTSYYFTRYEVTRAREIFVEIVDPKTRGTSSHGHSFFRVAT